MTTEPESPTPETDAAVVIYQSGGFPDAILDLCRSLERERNALRERVAALEAEPCVLGTGETQGRAFVVYLRDGAKITVGRDKRTKGPAWLEVSRQLEVKAMAPAPVAPAADAAPVAPTPCPMWYPLFKHLEDEHGLTLLESELGEIAAKADESRMRASGGVKWALVNALHHLTAEEMRELHEEIGKRCEPAPVPATASATVASNPPLGSGYVTCPGCGNSTDPDVCWCGGLMKSHNEGSGHNPVPMGCDCGRHKGPVPALTPKQIETLGILEKDEPDGVWLFSSLATVAGVLERYGLVGRVKEYRWRITEAGRRALREQGKAK